MSATANAYTLEMKAQLDALNVKVMHSERATDDAQSQFAKRDEFERLNPHIPTALASEEADPLRSVGENLGHKVIAEVEKLRDSFVNSFVQFKSQR